MLFLALSLSSTGKTVSIRELCVKRNEKQASWLVHISRLKHHVRSTGFTGRRSRLASGFAARNVQPCVSDWRVRVYVPDGCTKMLGLLPRRFANVRQKGRSLSSLGNVPRPRETVIHSDFGTSPEKDGAAFPGRTTKARALYSKIPHPVALFFRDGKAC